MKKIKKLMKYVFIVIVIVAAVVGIGVLGTNLYVRGSVKDRILKPDEAEELEDVDCILVLGASVQNNEKPSLMLQDRLDKGIELYFAGCSDKLLMSGDHGSAYYNEVNVMKNYAASAGIPTEDIFMDHAGFSTYESMYRARYIFNAKKVVIVTQKYHLYRSLYVAKQLGLDAYGVACEDIKYSGQTYRDVREVLAISKDFCKAIIKPEASLMGMEISLDGDGNVTNDN
ncbi:MAG: YdcF family protein [Clostridium sp.]|nr:YdcF family protein [Clostridium sp.]MCM1399751.1 YdcF family protein [Clostridium sp.]MCM1460414.1 YdcF family protein [Bacteroides sp.]